ncbi:DUF4083 family protein [Metasolibacillus fluoroglycofenilyticus]|uniref:DUF4083 family protein n=1 Tax=Metasolibacillus fluoroglycofenilyticus TaxID=1239396 RepID=UPI00137A23D6|nr:DUF4083 family protein [Metasolibacillus fluoroglycofenilyticus]
MEGAYHAGDIIATILFVLFICATITAVIIFFKRVSSTKTQQKEIITKLDTIIELLKQK